MDKKENDDMKKFFMMTIASLFAGAMLLSSCSDDDDKYYYPPSMMRGLVTVNPVDGGKSFTMRLDSATVLAPQNISMSPYGSKVVRALVDFIPTDATQRADTVAVNIIRMDSILTKPLAKDLGDQNATTYGTDAVDINLGSWVTIAEDGFLTLRFNTYWGGQQKHWVNLVADTNNPYSLTFYHSSNNDQKVYPADGIVAFDLSSLPDTNGKTVDLTLKWNSFNGERTTTFKYKSKTATTPAMVIGTTLFTLPIN